MTAEKIEPGPARAGDNESIQLGKPELALKEADGALAFLHAEGYVEASLEDEAELLRKIDWLITPLLFGVYIMAPYFILSTSLSSTTPTSWAWTKDTHMTAADFSYLATFFYVTFAVFRPVHGYLMQRFPTGEYLAVNIEPEHDGEIHGLDG